MKTTATLILLTFALFSAVPAAMGDTITHGTTTIDMDFVTVGNPGNSGDGNAGLPPAGSVDYVYDIGKYEVTADQWAAVIEADSNVGGAGAWSGSQPVGGVSWYGAAKFCNWLTTGSAATGVYTFDGPITAPTGVTINRDYRNGEGTAYFLPNYDEWYKAAYYDGDAEVYYNYPTGSSSTPDGIDFVGDTAFDGVFSDGYNQGHPNVVDNAGLASPYGTIAQGGDLFEWAGIYDEQTYLVMGGYYGTGASTLDRASIDGNGGEANNTIGFRVASVAPVPEPSTALLTTFGGIALFALRRRQP